MEYLWISMEYLRNTYGLSMESLWNVYGLSIEYIHGICTACSWNIHGTPMEYQWNTYGISLEYPLKPAEGGGLRPDWPMDGPGASLEAFRIYSLSALVAVCTSMDCLWITYGIPMGSICNIWRIHGLLMESLWISME